MVDKKLLKVNGVRAHPFEIPETEAAIVNFIVRDTAGTGSLYGSDDSVTTAVEFATGPNITRVTIGNSTADLNFLGDLDLNGDVGTSGQVAIINKSAGGGTNAAYAIERGLTGEDALLFWNETSDQFELGFGQTSAGTTLPAAPLSTYADLKINNLLLDSTAITADADLTITANTSTSDLALSARTASINLNDVDNLVLDSLYTATSIIGALNEIKGGDTEISGVGITYTNGEATSITRGQLVYISSTDTIMLSDASADDDEADVVGVVVNTSPVTAGSAAIIGSSGVFTVRFESGLTLSAGQEIFLSASTSGSATNVRPSSSVNIVQSIGTLKDTLSYNGVGNLFAQVHLIAGTKAAIS